MLFILGTLLTTFFSYFYNRDYMFLNVYFSKPSLSLFLFLFYFPTFYMSFCHRIVCFFFIFSFLFFFFYNTRHVHFRFFRSFFTFFFKRVCLRLEYISDIRYVYMNRYITWRILLTTFFILLLEITCS